MPHWHNRCDFAPKSPVCDKTFIQIFLFC
jgi:hypothetical protein